MPSLSVRGVHSQISSQIGHPAAAAPAPCLCPAARSASPPPCLCPHELVLRHPATSSPSSRPCPAPARPGCRWPAVRAPRRTLRRALKHLRQGGASTPCSSLSSRPAHARLRRALPPRALVVDVAPCLRASPTLAPASSEASSESSSKHPLLLRQCICVVGHVSEYSELHVQRTWKFLLSHL